MYPDRVMYLVIDRWKSVDESWRKMTHETTTMSRMHHPSKRLCEIIGRIDDTRDVVEQDVAIVLPLLNGKRLDIDVAGTIGRSFGIHNLDSRDVIHIDGSGGPLGEAKFCQDSTKVFSCFGGQDGGKEFCFSGTGSSDSLCLGLVGNDTMVKDKAESCGRSSVAKVIGMSSIHKTGEFLWINVWKGWEVFFSRNKFIRTMGEVWIDLGAPEDNAPSPGLPEILCYFLEELKVNIRRASRKLAKGHCSITYIRPACDVGIKEFT